MVTSHLRYIQAGHQFCVSQTILERPLTVAAAATTSPVVILYSIVVCRASTSAERLNKTTMLSSLNMLYEPFPRHPDLV